MELKNWKRVIPEYLNSISLRLSYKLEIFESYRYNTEENIFDDRPLSMRSGWRLREILRRYREH